MEQGDQPQTRNFDRLTPNLDEVIDDYEEQRQHQDYINDDVDAALDTAIAEGAYSQACQTPTPGSPTPTAELDSNFNSRTSNFNGFRDINRQMIVNQIRGSEIMAKQAPAQENQSPAQAASHPTHAGKTVPNMPPPTTRTAARKTVGKGAANQKASKDKKKKKRTKAGAAALKEIRKMHERTKFFIPKLAFARLVREIMHERIPDLRIQGIALDDLQAATENSLGDHLSNANLLGIHAKRIAVQNKDMKLAFDFEERYKPEAWRPLPINERRKLKS